MADADYKGRPPQEVYVVSIKNTFRTYVHESRAINRLTYELKKGNSPELSKYRLVEEE